MRYIISKLLRTHISAYPRTSGLISGFRKKSGTYLDVYPAYIRKGVPSLTSLESHSFAARGFVFGAYRAYIKLDHCVKEQVASSPTPPQEPPRQWHKRHRRISRKKKSTGAYPDAYQVKNSCAHISAYIGRISGVYQTFLRDRDNRFTDVAI